ncbi:MAG: hypothetical protein U5R31_08260 [Acidimicrobiia bacterium]|nr:hypothetical protein [Acidimicrobiia bacterium]
MPGHRLDHHAGRRGTTGSHRARLTRHRGGPAPTGAELITLQFGDCSASETSTAAETLGRGRSGVVGDPDLAVEHRERERVVPPRREDPGGLLASGVGIEDQQLAVGRVGVVDELGLQ